MNSKQQDEAEGGGGKKRTVIIACLYLGYFMMYMKRTAVDVAIPAMLNGAHADRMGCCCSALPPLRLLYKAL